MRYELSDYEWTAIKPMLPDKPRGVRRVNDRRVRREHSRGRCGKIRRASGHVLGERCVPISPFLQDKAFDPEGLVVLNAVFVEVCQQLGLTDKADPATQLVAEKIIELAGGAGHDRESLRKAAHLYFQLDP